MNLTYIIGNGFDIGFGKNWELVVENAVLQDGMS